MTQIDTAPREIRIGRDWKRSLALPAICLCLVLIFLYGVQIEPDSYHDRRFQRASWMLLPVLAGLLLFTTWRLFVPRGAPVRVSSAGFLDLRAGRALIPWSEVRNVARRGQYVVLTLKLRHARRYSFTLTQRLLKATRKSAGPSHLLVADWCLNTTQERLLELTTGYWRAHREATGA